MLYRVKSRSDTAEEKSSEFEDTTIKTFQNEAQTENKMHRASVTWGKIWNGLMCNWSLETGRHQNTFEERVAKIVSKLDYN